MEGREKAGHKEKDGRKGRTYNNESSDGPAIAMDDRREGTAMGTTVTGKVPFTTSEHHHM